MSWKKCLRSLERDEFLQVCYLLRPWELIKSPWWCCSLIIHSSLLLDTFGSHQLISHTMSELSGNRKIMQRVFCLLAIAAFLPCFHRSSKLIETRELCIDRGLTWCCLFITWVQISWLKNVQNDFLDLFA